METTRWRKSTYSNGDGGACVEVNDANPGEVRDSKDPQGPTLLFSPDGWQQFLDAVKSDSFSI